MKRRNEETKSPMTDRPKRLLNSFQNGNIEVSFSNTIMQDQKCQQNKSNRFLINQTEFTDDEYSDLNKTLQATRQLFEWFADYSHRIRQKYEDDIQLKRLGYIGNQKSSKRLFLKELMECTKELEEAQTILENDESIKLNFVKTKPIWNFKNRPDIQHKYPLINFYTSDQGCSLFSEGSPLSYLSKSDFRQFQYFSGRKQYEDLMSRIIREIRVLSMQADQPVDVKILNIHKWCRYLLKKLFRIELNHSALSLGFSGTKEEVFPAVVFCGENMPQNEFQTLKTNAETLPNNFFYRIISHGQISTSKLLHVAKNFADLNPNHMKVVHKIYLVQPRERELQEWTKFYPEADLQFKFISIEEHSHSKHEKEVLGFEVFGHVISTYNSIKDDHGSDFQLVESIVPAVNTIPYCEGGWKPIDDLETFIRNLAEYYLDCLNRIAVCRRAIDLLSNDFKLINNESYYESQIEQDKEQLNVVKNVMSRLSVEKDGNIPRELAVYLDKVSHLGSREKEIFRSLHLIDPVDVRVVILGKRPSKFGTSSTGVPYSQDKDVSFRDPRTLFFSNYLLIRCLQYDYNVYGSRGAFWKDVIEDFKILASREQNKYSSEDFEAFLREYCPAELSLIGASSVDVPKDSSGNLEDWASEGVLLLNRNFTPQENEKSKSDTKKIVDIIMKGNPKCVFIVWGADNIRDLRIPYDRLLSFTQPVYWIQLFKKNRKRDAFKNMIDFIKGRFFSKANSKLPESEKVYWLLNGKWGDDKTDEL